MKGRSRMERERRRRGGKKMERQFDTCSGWEQPPYNIVPEELHASCSISGETHVNPLKLASMVSVVE